MTVADYIRTQVLEPKLKTAGCLLVYDPDRRYRDLTRKMASPNVAVIDATESSIESREAASRALRELASRGEKARVVIYVPARKPVTNEQKRVNPFSVYGECGAVFPEDDSEAYQSLCIKAKSEYETEIRQKFAETPNPPFAVIDAIGGGVRWPQLRTVLGAESANEILAAFLSPSAEQREALKAAEGWQEELRDLLASVLGMTLITKAKLRDTIANEVWRFLLFSEFVFDLPGELPPSLAPVPKAPIERRTAVETLCDVLRKNADHRDRYIQMAEAIERELNLRAACSAIEDLGVRDTFPFEERTFLRRAIDRIQKGDLNAARQLVGRLMSSVWRERSETVEQWDVVEAALKLVQWCEDLDGELPSGLKSPESTVAFYTTRLRHADLAHRELERTAVYEPDDLVEPVVTYARKRYRDLMEIVQTAFVKHVEQHGWPVPGVLENAAAFDKIVAPMLEEKGRRVALLVVDALRYELAAELLKDVAEGEVEFRAACAALPTITPVGMASVLPGAATGLELSMDGDTLLPRLNGTPLKSVKDRMDVLAKKFGDRFKEMPMTDFLQKKKVQIPGVVDLLVLRTHEIDNLLESDATYGVKMIPTLLKDLTTAIAKVRKLGFRDVVVVTDHGFVLNAAAETGDVCAKPQGAWRIVHDRLAVGEGEGDAHNFAVPSLKLGVRASFSRIAGPRSFAPYRQGVRFFHGGLSLQEAIVPVIKARFALATQEAETTFKVSISYKGGQTKRVTTRLPVVTLTVTKSDLFAPDATVELRVDAIDKTEAVVGEPRIGDGVDPSTHAITMKTGESRGVTLRMSEEFEGKFTVRVLDPRTMTAYDSIDLETSYTV